MNYISTEDYAYLYGFGVFETMLINEGGAIFQLEEHLKRMFSSADFLGLKLPFTQSLALDKVNQYIVQNNFKNKVLRITINGGNKLRNIESSITFSTRENKYTCQLIEKGASIALSKVLRNETSMLVSHKTSNYLENLLELQRAIEENCDDAIFLNTKSKITETTKANIFFVKDMVLYTPSLKSGILPGIIRNWVIEEAKRINFICIQGEFDLDDLMNADEIFLTNSLFGIMHVREICKKNISNNENYYVSKIFKDIIKQYF